MNRYEIMNMYYYFFAVSKFLDPGFRWRFQKPFLHQIWEEVIKESLQNLETYMDDVIVDHNEAPSDDLLSHFMKKRNAADRPFFVVVLQRIVLNFILMI